MAESTLRSESSKESPPIDAIAGAYSTRPDGSVVKDYEALVQYIRDESAANGGLLPSRYDENAVEGGDSEARNLHRPRVSVKGCIIRAHP